MRRLVLAGLASACLVLATGCQPAVVAVPGSNAWSGPSPDPHETLPVPSPEPEPEPSPRFVATPRGQEAGIPLTCGDEDLAVGFGPVQSALGTRVMEVGLRNCGDEGILLGRPTLEGVDSGLATHAISADATDGGTLPPDGRATLELNWHSNGRCERGVQRLSLSVAGTRTTVEDCFQLGGDHAPDDEPTVWARWR
ncbi:DUF4232 domain-containing protein [uncultured Tessaracoccus sp.]|uniref:DUF4232 domain-containing protein n=1 Tax=uncultured Tessaracoccus sp. TaxID=905023 RepID=UPI002600EDA8|nr:DUF4232 domain-containing protein [uncultured Tessaracoccus sp.]